MKKTIIVLVILSCVLSTHLYSQSTFKAQTLEDAVTSFVQNQVQVPCNVNILTKLTDVRLRQSGVKAEMLSDGDLHNDCSVRLLFKLGDKTLLTKKINLNVSPADADTTIHVKKNSKVKLLLYSGSICIKSDGTALDDGYVGDVIRVKECSNNTLYGFVASDGNVVIDNTLRSELKK